MPPKLGLIAGNGRFPFLVLDAARGQGYEVVVAAIKEETFPEIESRGAAAVYWLSLGELSKLIQTFHQEGITRAVMAGQVKHKQIFSSIRPDWRLAKLLLSLTTRNTDSLLGAVAKVLADEGIALENSTALLEPLLVKPGVPTKRAPSEQECEEWLIGLESIARGTGEHEVVAPVVRRLPLARRDVIHGDRFRAHLALAVCAHGSMPIEQPLSRLHVRVATRR